MSRLFGYFVAAVLASQIFFGGAEMGMLLGTIGIGAMIGLLIAEKRQ